MFLEGANVPSPYVFLTSERYKKRESINQFA